MSIPLNNYEEAKIISAMKSTYIVAILFSLLCLSAQATQRQTTLNTNNITTANGLSHNSVRSIFQDSRGFIWLGTLQGICRYDGYNIKRMDDAGGIRPTISDMQVKEIQEDSHGLLWITNSGDKVNCYNPAYHAFVNFAQDDTLQQRYRNVTLYPDEVWLWGKNGAMRVRRDGKKRFSTFRIDRQTRRLDNDQVNQVARTDDGTVWLATTRGVCRVENEQVKLISDAHYFGWCTARGNNIYAVCDDGNICRWDEQSGKMQPTARMEGESKMSLTGQIVDGDNWILLTSKGSYVYNFKTQTCSRWNERIKGGYVVGDLAKEAYVIHHGTGTVQIYKAGRGIVKEFTAIEPEQMRRVSEERYIIKEDSRGIFWVSTRGNGLWAYLPEEDALHHFTSTTSNGMMPCNELLTVQEDRNGTMWIGTELGGVVHATVVKRHERIKMPHPGDTKYLSYVRVVKHMDNGDICVASRKGEVYIYDKELQKMKRRISTGTKIYDVAEDTAGVLWMASRGNGLYVGEKIYRKNRQDEKSPGIDSHFSLLRDKKGRMWVGSFGDGLYLAERADNLHASLVFRKFFQNISGMNQIRALIQDRRGMIWAATSNGLVVFNPDSLLTNENLYYRYTKEQGLKENDLRCLYEDSKNRVWTGEYGGGTTMMEIRDDDYAHPIARHYGTELGLINNVVQSIVEDTAGRIWLATEYGISYLDSDTSTFHNFLFSSVYMNNVYSENSAILLADGQLAIGGMAGVTLIKPTAMLDNITKTEVRLTGLYVNGEDAHPALSEPGKPWEGIAYRNEVKLAYNQNSIEIYFSTLSYELSTPPTYMYRLEGVDKDWSRASKRNFAQYRGLRPGNYTLRVKACNAAGIWSEETAMKLCVNPPIWSTWWAKVVYVLFIIGGITLFLTTVRRIEILKTRVGIERELTDYKLSFFTNVSHEFRTPLTLMRVALDKLHEEKNASAETQHAVSVLDRSAGRMMHLINELLTFRKVEKNKYELHPEPTDISAMIEEIFQSMSEIAQSRGIGFTLQTNARGMTVKIDRDSLEKIATNLMSNAIKYTPSGGCVKVELQIKDAELMLQVSDTGVGIPMEKRKDLFTPFMQSTFTPESMGLGLHLTYQLVRACSGKIKYEENRNGIGSIFTVTLPCSTSEEANISSEEIVVTTEDIEIRHDDMITPSGNSRRILIIEDDIDVRELLKRELSATYEVVTAADGKLGLDKAQYDDFDLVVCDVMMPVMNGFEVTRRLKDDFDTCHLPIILLTALGDDDHRLKGIASGADAYVAKPFSMAYLRARIEGLIESREKMRQRFVTTPILDPALLASSQNNRDRTFIEKLNHVIQQQMSNAEFSVEDFASEMAMGRTKLFHKVKGLTGYTPKEYLRIIRMKHAAELLVKTELPIGEIAVMVGVPATSTFNKTFNDQFGITPSGYRKTNNKE